jgi:hypothetical protein
MEKSLSITLSGLLALCISNGAIASDERGQANGENRLLVRQQLTPQGDAAKYGIGLQKGQHIIIVNAPDRRIIRVDAERHQTVIIETSANTAVPFVHLRISRPTIPRPIQQVSAL